jgi:hypothetical protein
MSVPGPVITGTIVYSVIGAILLSVIAAARAGGSMSKDNAQ